MKNPDHTINQFLGAAGFRRCDMRKLIRLADEAGWPISGRTIRLPGVLGDLYGAKLVFDHTITEPCIECQIMKVARTEFITLDPEYRQKKAP